MERSTLPWTAKQICRMTENGALVFDNIIQRGFVWDIKRQSLLIDSMLRGYPIPPFYAVRDGRKVKTNNGEVSVYDCLDGKQRCKTIWNYLTNTFPLVGLNSITDPETGETVDLNGKFHKDLPEALKERIDTYTLNAVSFVDATKEEIVELMSRLNNGKPLTGVEKARIRAADLKGIQEVASHPFFTKYMSEKAINGYNNEDIVVKTHLLLTTENPRLDNSVVNPYYEKLVLTKEEKKRITKIFDAVLKIVEQMVADKKVPQAKKLMKKTHLLSMVKLIDNGIKFQFVDALPGFFEEFFTGNPTKSSMYNDYCQKRTAHAESVQGRDDAVNLSFKQYNTW